MAGGGTIDLGVYGARQYPGPARGHRWWPWRWWRSWPPHRRARLRRRLAVVLAVLVTATLAGDAAPAPPVPALTPVWTVPDSGNARPSTDWSRYAVGRRHLYMTAPTPASGWELIAYRLTDGAVRWRAPLDGIANEVGVRVVDGVPVVTTRGRLPAHTAVHEPRTGRLRWHHRGYPEAAGGGRVLLRRALPAADRSGGPPPAAAPYELAAADLRTGRVAWTVPLGADHRLRVHEPADGAAYLLTLRGDGRLVRRDLATGEVVAATGTGVRSGELYLGDRLVFLSDHAPPGDTTAYDARTLAPRWRVRHTRGLWPCGPVVCAGTAEGVRGLDPAGGEVRWSLPCLPGGTSGGTPPCAARARLLEPPATLWVGTSRGSRSGSWVVDARTGERVTDLQRWRPRWRLDGSAWGAAWMTGAVGAGTAGDGSGVPWRLWLARLPADLSAVELLGSFETRWWRPRDRYVVSWHERDGLRVWRIH